MSRQALDAAVTDLTLALGLLVRRLHSAVPGEAADLSWTQKAVLTRLADGRMTTAELARAESITPQSMGTAVAALEALGLVDRLPHPTDKRQLTVGLTPKGATARKTTKDAKRAWLTDAVTRLDKADQATLRTAADVLKRLAES